MIAILDANVLLRLTDMAAAQHTAAIAAVTSLRSQGYLLRTLAQSHFEFWVVATRPQENNGLGLSPIDCDLQIARHLSAFPALESPPGLLAEWRQVVLQNNCIGKIAHDARYVAAMRLHAISHIVTFNGQDFERFSGIIVIDPQKHTATPTS